MNAQEMPKANSQLLVEIIESETVAYHQGTREIHRLEPVASKVFSLCDGKTLRTEAAQIAFPDESNRLDRLEALLVKMEEKGLIERELAFSSRRREFLKRAAAVTLLGSAITTFMAPTASAAQSHPITPVPVTTTAPPPTTPAPPPTTPPPTTTGTN
jgi:hypothetical protein